MKLKKEELSQLNEIITDYKKVHDGINELESEMNLIQEKRESLLTKLTHIRDIETTFEHSLIDKYGNGSINIETSEYERE